MKKTCVLVFVVIFALALVACSGTQPSKTEEQIDEPTATAEPMANTPATYSIELSEPENALFVGDSVQLVARASSTSAAEKELSVIWSSSDPGVATVDENGVVSGVSAGSAIITASVSGHPEAAAEVGITVGEHVSEVRIDRESMELLAGTSKADAVLHADVIPESAAIQEIIFSSSDESIVTVDSEGSIHAIAPGTATITVSSADDACNVSAVCHVSVSQGVTEIKLSEENLTLYFGEGASLTAEVFPEGAANRDIEWSSSDENVIAVSEDGSITTIGSGKADILCSSTDGSEVTGRCPVEVIIAVESLEISDTKATLLLGASEDLNQKTLSCTTMPENASYQTVTWASSDEAVAVVDENGTVTGVGSGKATITATTTDPRFSDTVSASCTVTVGDAVSEIQISGKQKIVKGKTAQLKVSVLPESALITGVKWSSSDEKILTVDKDGKVHAHKTGTAIVTCTAKDGSGTVATYSITVYQPVTKLTPSKKSTVVLFAGQTITLSAKASPENASDKSVTWKSSKESVATVDANGVVTAVGKGKATITATTRDGSKISCKFTIQVEPANPLTVVDAGHGIYNADLFSLTVKNTCATKTVVNFSFDIDLYSFTGERLVTSGSYNLGSNVSIGPGATREIRRTHAGISATYQMKIVITEIEFSDKTVYAIPRDEQIEWTITRQ